MFFFFFLNLCRVQERLLCEQRGHTDLDDAGKLPVSKTFSSMNPHWNLNVVPVIAFNKFSVMLTFLLL